MASPGRTTSPWQVALTIDAQIALRRAFMFAAYEEARGARSTVLAADIGDKLGISAEDLKVVLEGCASRGWIYDAHMSPVLLEAAGLRYVEKERARDRAAASEILSREERRAIESFLLEVRRAEQSSNLDALSSDERAQWSADIMALEAQYRGPKSRRGVVRELLSSLRSIGENLAASAIWVALEILERRLG